MLAIVCKHGPAIGVSERQNVVVWDTQTGQIRVGHRHHIVAELPQCFDGRNGKVLIGEEAGQRLGLLIFSDLAVNFVAVTGDKRPGVDQVGRRECGERAEDLGFSQTESPILRSESHMRLRSLGVRIC